MAMMEKINKNTSGEIIDKSSRPRNFNRNNFYSRNRNRNTTHTWPANNNNRQPMKSMQCFKCGRSGHIQKFCRTNFIRKIDEQQDDMQTHTDSFYENSEGTNDELINFISKPSFFPYKTVNDNKTTISHQKFNYTQKIKHGKNQTQLKSHTTSLVKQKKYPAAIEQMEKYICGDKKALKTLPML